MVVRPWFRLYFMQRTRAWPTAATFGQGSWAKLALTLFRLAAVIFGTFYLIRIVREKYHNGFILCAALIYAGAMGNLIDSLFYGLIFTDSIRDGALSQAFTGHGYAGFLHGLAWWICSISRIINNKIMPSWVPFWGGKAIYVFPAHL